MTSEQLSTTHNHLFLRPKGRVMLTKDPGVLVEDNVMAMLALAQMDYPDIFLAGGYLRDRILGIEPKDIDFWTWKPLLEGRVYTADSENSVAADDIGRIAGVERIIDRADIQAFREGLSKDRPMCDYPVEIVHLHDEKTRDIRTVVQTFAFGIQQIAYLVDEKTIWWSPMFDHDLLNLTMTVSRTQDTSEAFSIYNKWKSLTAKRFKGWKLVIPEQFADKYEQFCTPGQDENIVVRANG